MFFSDGNVINSNKKNDIKLNDISQTAMSAAGDLDEDSATETTGILNDISGICHMFILLLNVICSF